MRILQVHNRYRHRGGECVVFDKTVSILSGKKHHVLVYTRQSRELDISYSKKINGLIHSVYSAPAFHDFIMRLEKFQPDIVHVHNLFPLITPSILLACKRKRIPTVMTCHNYRMVCPIGIFFRRGETCYRCRGGKVFHCIFQNCRDQFPESVLYAIQTAFARICHLKKCLIDRYIAISGFVRQFLVENGYPYRKISVVANPVDMPRSCNVVIPHGYVGWVGRMSAEKGIDCFLEAARQNPDIPFRAAGADTEKRTRIHGAPRNVQFAGHLSSNELTRFYQGARMIVVPSLCPESFGLAAVEAMAHGVPVIASRAGALPEVVRNGETGLLFNPGDIRTLASKIRMLWIRPNMCRELGSNARNFTMRNFTDDLYYSRLMAVYKQVLEKSEKDYDHSVTEKI